MNHATAFAQPRNPSDDDALSSAIEHAHVAVERPDSDNDELAAAPLEMRIAVAPVAGAIGALVTHLSQVDFMREDSHDEGLLFAAHTLARALYQQSWYEGTDPASHDLGNLTSQLYAVVYAAVEAQGDTHDESDETFALSRQQSLLTCAVSLAEAVRIECVHINCSGAR